MLTSSAEFKLAISPYQFPLQPPLETAYGRWSVREGLIVKLTDVEGQSATGEIAPLPWFGTESLATAHQFCQRLGNTIAPTEIQQIPDDLPCCQFGLGSALANYQGQLQATAPTRLTGCQLLSTGAAALAQIATLSPSPQTVKWKIGVQAPTLEQNWLAKILAELPIGTRMRLDANGSLTEAQAHQWLAFLDQINMTQDNVTIEFLEQPLHPKQADQLLGLSNNYQTPIALDESVCHLAQLQAWNERGWLGFYILKAAILGNPQQLNDWLINNPIQAIFSTVFETEVGRGMLLNLARHWNAESYAVGISSELLNL